MRYAFDQKIPKYYDEFIGPVLFEPHAREITAWIPQFDSGFALELSAGTGRVTRHLRASLDDKTLLVATDISAAMVEFARWQSDLQDNIFWCVSDGIHPPFAFETFDCVLCQFGAMFFEDRVTSFRKTRECMKPGSTFLLITWDRIEHNPLPHAIHTVVHEIFPERPNFYEVPFGWFDPLEIRSEMTAAGFRKIEIERLKLQSGTTTAQRAAAGFTHGNPVLSAVGRDNPDLVTKFESSIESRLTSEFGCEFSVPMSALVVRCTKESA